ncbi:MAG: hypothetical protein ACR2LH_06280, partial [Thermoleophilaceae bacterium]
MPRHRVRSLSHKLALLFFAITAAAFSVLYFYVVPQLGSNLEQRKLDALERVTQTSKASLQALMGSPEVSADELNRRVRALADGADARLTLLGVQQGPDGPTRRKDLRFYVISDSRAERVVPENDALAAEAVVTRRSIRGRGRLGGEVLGELAQPPSSPGRIERMGLPSSD